MDARKQVRFLARRGMRELDVLFEAYIAKYFKQEIKTSFCEENSDILEAELQEFFAQILIHNEDADLFNWILYGHKPQNNLKSESWGGDLKQDEMANIINRRLHSLNTSEGV